ncbi:hypothetical protein L7F22_035614 [Adiantum nelumboides]|nr:hypothetical protein [Adiantum nelumboides]
MSDVRDRTRASFEILKQTVLQRNEVFKNKRRSIDVEVLKAEGERCRREFLEKARLEPPSQMRLINCQATCEENQVVLMDWCIDEPVEFAAVSHTFGMEVYAVFDCECTTKCLTKVPRCSEKPCLRHDSDSDPRNRVVQDILNMCAILKSAGVEYAWHDGVCIAQHNEDEVVDTIKHIGWIYSHARETIIFLHYIGTPMAPIKLDGDLKSRWQTRVWTLQEAALSRRRRYCMRVVSGSTGEMSFTWDGCKSLQEVEDMIASWYRDDSSEVAVIEEEEYWKMIVELDSLIVPLQACLTANSDPSLILKLYTWGACVSEWMATLVQTCFRFPTVAVALHACSSRDSKHEGDRINSILALAGVKDFVVPKDGNMEASFVENFIEFIVFEDGKMELRGEMACVAVKFTFFTSTGMKEKASESGDVIVIQEIAATPSIAMDLTYAVADGYTAVLAQASSLALGTAVVPMMGDSDATAASTEPAPYYTPPQYAAQAALSLLVEGTFARACAKTEPGWMEALPSPATAAASTSRPKLIQVRALLLGQAIFPMSESGGGLGPHVQGRDIQDKESFWAHLVLPRQPLLQHHAFSSRRPLSQVPLWDWRVPALLVQGDLTAQVSKIGCFHLKRELKDIFKTLLPTTINKLVII